MIDSFSRLLESERNSKPNVDFVRFLKEEELRIVKCITQPASVRFVVSTSCWLCAASWESCGSDGARFRKDFLYRFVWTFHIFLSWVKRTSKSQANHCVSPGLCSNFVFAIRTRAVGKKNDWNIFIYIFFFKRMKKKKTTIITKNRTLLALQKKSQTW